MHHGIPWSVADVWGAAMGHELVPNEQTSSWCCDPLGLFGDRIFVRKHNKCLKSSDNIIIAIIIVLYTVST